MLLVISPAKNLDYETPPPTKRATKATMLDEAQTLIDQLKPLSPQQVSSLMGISDALGVLNYDRYQNWQRPFTKTNAKQAMFAFKGDVYIGLQAYDFDAEDIDFAQRHLRMLSGLYGVLRPLDLIQPYRLEMGTKLKNSKGKDLYDFWADKITETLNKQLKATKSDVLINLASNEYFKSVHRENLRAEVITPVFKDYKNGQYKVLSFFAKKARGLMSAYIIKNRLGSADQIKHFDWHGYAFNSDMSNDREFVFTRDEPI